MTDPQHIRVFWIQYGKDCNCPHPGTEPTPSCLLGTRPSPYAVITPPQLHTEGHRSERTNIRWSCSRPCTRRLERWLPGGRPPTACPRGCTGSNRGPLRPSRRRREKYSSATCPYRRPRNDSLWHARSRRCAGSWWGRQRGRRSTRCGGKLSREVLIVWWFLEWQLPLRVEYERRWRFV